MQRLWVLSATQGSNGGVYLCIQAMLTPRMLLACMELILQPRRVHTCSPTYTCAQTCAQADAISPITNMQKCTPAVRVAGACSTQTPNRKARNRWDLTHNLLSYEARVWKNTHGWSNPSCTQLVTSVRFFLTPNSSLCCIAVIKILIFFSLNQDFT